MKPLKAVGLITLMVLLVGGIRGYFIWKERHAPVVVKSRYEERNLTADEVVQPRKLYIDDLKSARTLKGKSVWMQAGNQMDYYPYVSNHVDFAHKAGVLPSIQELKIEDMVTQKAPEAVLNRIPHGTSQVLAVFELPGSPKQYATPVGYLDGSDSKFMCDDLFFYDDPHQLYKHWPADVWQSVDAHQAKTGMSELQVTMALGNLQQSDSSNYGNRTVHYSVAGGKQVTVDYTKDHATEVKVE
jgi:hypothetical protein